MPTPSPALSSLAETLRTEPHELTHLDRLGPDALYRLETLVLAAASRDAEAIDEALQQTLRILPRILRGRAKKLLFPEEH